MLRHRRDVKGLTNQKVADLLSADLEYEVTEKRIRNLLSGSDEPSLRIAYGLERVLGIAEGDSLATAGKRTPQGDPSTPPVQPKNEPTHPTTRREQDRTTHTPRVADDRPAVAS